MEETRKINKIFGILCYKLRENKDYKQSEKTEWYCPRCGNKEIWKCKEDPDWPDEQYICTICKTGFHVLPFEEVIRSIEKTSR